MPKKQKKLSGSPQNTSNKDSNIDVGKKGLFDKLVDWFNRIDKVVKVLSSIILGLFALVFTVYGYLKCNKGSEGEPRLEIDTSITKNVLIINQSDSIIDDPSIIDKESLARFKLTSKGGGDTVKITVTTELVGLESSDCAIGAIGVEPIGPALIDTFFRPKRSVVKTIIRKLPKGSSVVITIWLTREGECTCIRKFPISVKTKPGLLKGTKEFVVYKPPED